MREDWFELDLSPVGIFRKIKNTFSATAQELEGRTRFHYNTFAAYLKFLTQFGKKLCAMPVNKTIHVSKNQALMLLLYRKAGKTLHLRLPVVA